MQTRYSIEIAASPAAVFLWLEDLDKQRAWMSHVLENEWLTRTAEKVGSTFRSVHEGHAQQVEVQGRVTGYEPARRLEVHLEAPQFTAQLEYALEPLAEGTRLMHASEVQFRGMWKLMAGALGSMLHEQGMQQLARDFARLKALCEQASD